MRDCETEATMNDQQGPMAAYIRETPSLEANYPSVLAKAREFDTAFAAMESALRSRGHAQDCRIWTAVVDKRHCSCGVDAALALAEGVRRE